MPDFFTIEERADENWLQFMESFPIAQFALTSDAQAVLEEIFKNGYVRGANDELSLLQQRRKFNASP